ncbi:hypothetical protein DY000_02017521 [Brassica cretica]|uniref:Uncharacterized protein n=1 Tax=Brassica cretica TaxID=69181 RepID=A0ABQ7CRY8_BRACR|nr:hypothetical protein DY000_02017521 [Brassica cretica]
MNAPTHQSEGTSRKSIRSKNPNSADKRLPSIDTTVSTSIDSHSKPQLPLSTKNMSIDYDFLLPDEFGIFRDQDGHARAMDGRILQVSREDIAYIFQLANGVDNLFTQQRSIPDNNPTVPDGNLRANTTGPIVQTWHIHHRSIDVTNVDIALMTAMGPESSDGNRRTNMVSTDESGRARSAAGDMIPVTKDDIRKILERASLFGESHTFLRAHATSFKPKNLTPEIYTKDEINEMVTEIESMQHNLEKEATTSPSIDANKSTSIDVKPQTSQIPAEPKSLAEKKDECEIAYINTRINDVYNPLNNNVDWLSTRIDLLQQELHTIRMNDPQPVTSIDICNITSIDTRFAALEDRLKSYEDMHDRFTSPIMRYLDTLSTQMMNVQKDIGKLNDQHNFQEEGSTSIDRFPRTSLDGKKPTEHLPYTAADVDQITSKLYTAIDTLEDRLEKRCDGIYFPFDVKFSGLDSQAEWLQKEVNAIQRQLASQHQISASIDRAHSKSIDSKALETIDRHLVTSIDTTSTPDDAQLIPQHMESMQEQLNELSEYAYSKISWYQFSIEDILERLQNISNAVNLVELGNDLGYIAACHCGAQYETEYSESIDTHSITSIDSNKSPTTDERYPTSLDGMQPVDHSTLPDQYYPDFAFQQPNRNGLETVILSSNEDPTEEYDEDYCKEIATEITMHDERYSTHSFHNTPTPSIDRVYSTSVNSHPHPAKRSSASIDTTPGTSINIKAAASEKEKGNIPIPNRFTNNYIRIFAPKSTSHETEAGKMNAPTHQSKGPSRRSIRSKNPNSADKRLPSIDTPISTSIDSHSKPKLSLSTKNISIDYDFLLPDEFGIFRDQDGHARAMDGRILQVSRENITNIVQLANGVDNLFTQQCNIPDNNPAVLDVYPEATITGIGSHQTCKSDSQSSIDKVVSTSLDRVTPTSIDKTPSPSIDRRYECGRHAYDSYGARKFRWEQKDEYGVYRDESGYARSADGDMIPVTKDDIRKILERASLFGEGHICLPEHVTSFTPTTLTPEIYTKDEINEMVTGICRTQEKLGEELKTLTSQIPVELESLAEKKEEWEIAYINMRINDVYNPLNKKVDWLSTRIDLLQQDLDTIRMNDPQPATSIDICNIISISTRFAAMEDRLKSYEDMHDRFTSPIMRYLDTLSTQMINVQKDIADAVDQITSKLYKAIDTLEDQLEKRCDDIYFPFDVKFSRLDSQAEWLQKEVRAIQRQLTSQHHISASIDRAHSKSIDSKEPATIDRHLVASIDTTSIPDDAQLIPNHMESMQEQLNELSEYAYNKISWYLFSIEDILERLHNISNAVQKTDERWTRNDEATRNSTKMLKWINLSTIHTCLDCLKEPKLTCNTKPDITACLGACNLQGSLHKEFLGIGQKEGNMAWWELPLSLDSWKSVQSWSLILQWKQTLTQEGN